VARLKGAQKRAEKVRPAGSAAFEHFLGSINRDRIWASKMKELQDLGFGNGAFTSPLSSPILSLQD